MKRQGLDDKVELVFEDYRDTTGTFDGIASVEMIEAVGEAHWPAYFKTLFDRLKPGGAAAIQGITILGRELRRLSQWCRFHPALHLSRAACC